MTDSDIYRSHAGALVGLATVLVGPDDAQDVVSSAVLRSISNTGWGRVSNRRAYLYRAVTNEARNLRRGDSRRRARETRSAQPSEASLPEVYPEVRAALERLSVRQRAVVYLTYWEDMTDHMAAECLGISAGSVRRHLARAKTRLRKVLHD